MLGSGSSLGFVASDGPRLLDASITNRVLGLRASDRKLVEGLVSCVRAGGGEVVLGTVSSRRPRIVLPKRKLLRPGDISGVDPATRYRSAGGIIC